jgi:alpha-glucosidase (family GH31 glycosyl hydrolase)
VAEAALTEECGVSINNKIDCGTFGDTESSCTDRGCCWSEVNDNTTPWCFYPVNSGVATYELKHDMNSHEGGMEGTLVLSSGKDTWGPNIETLKVEMLYETEDTFRVRVTDPDHARYEVPQSMVERKSIGGRTKLDAHNVNYEVSYTQSPFTFEVLRKADGKSLFNMDSSIIFKDQYLELSTTLATDSKIYGLGESTRFEQAMQPGNTFTLWAADIPAASFYKNLYGSFPYYINHLPDGTAHGALLMNSNGMDIVLESGSLTFKTIGGIIDVYIFSGNSPASVVQQYMDVVGKPMMVPYWSLGYHNCKYGYTNVTEVEDVVKGYQAAQIPLDTQWMDIDYMQNWRDFTWDSVNFPTNEVASFVDSLHDGGLHFVPIIDPGIMIYNNYDAYEQGLTDDIFIKDLTKTTPYMGQVWPGPVYFPDWLNPKTANYWATQLSKWWSTVKFDGLWIDMNEASNFCNVDGQGQVCVNDSPNCPTGQLETQCDCCLTCEAKDTSNIYDFPPYAIHNQQGNGALGTKTIAPSAFHYDETQDYDVHNLYGLGEQIATNAALTEIRNERPFLLTRSSFVGSGKHTAKWTGDNFSGWDDLRSSIVSLFDFNMFGIPMIGADICGFLGDSNEELCARWIEVGAFYPFSRNHNSLGQKPQELYLWDSVTQAAQNALGVRYRILPFLYTLMYNAHEQGETVIRPLWMNFPSDKTASGIDYQFMLGDELLISPVVYEGSDSVEAYFPTGSLWYDFYTTELAVDASTKGITKTLDTPLTSVNVHIRGGSILAMQDSAMTTTQSRQTPFNLVVALCPKKKAFGELFLDDGISTSVKGMLISFQAEDGKLTAKVKKERDSNVNDQLAQICIVSSSQDAPTTVKVDGSVLDNSQWSFESGKLTVKVSLKITSPFTLEWA